jgi:trk system potassium uptake protein
MKIVIIGCGRLGASLAIDAAEQGHQVTIVDKEPRSFNRLPEDLRSFRMAWM